MRVNAAGVRLRFNPTTESEILIESIPLSSSIIQLDPVGAWIKVSVDGRVGWVAASYIENSDPEPPLESDQQYSLEELYPMMQDTFPPEVLAAICYQESTFINWRVHRDGTGHGLFGLDDNGMLPDFERWSGLSVGRGSSASIIPVDLQIEYTKQKLQEYSIKYGGPYNAARVWHRGEGQWQDSYGDIYEARIRQHVADLFP